MTISNISNISNGRYTIYTKKDCVYCDRAKELIKDALIVSVETMEAGKYQEFLDMMRSYDHHTFPMIFFNETFIGGFEQARDHKQNENTEKTKYEEMDDF